MSTRPAFICPRPDGRSNAQVISDFVKDDEPGTLYSFSELAGILGEGTERSYGQADVRQIVPKACSRLLADHQRTLHSVRGRGYRLAPASSHNGLALDRKQRADKQLRRGLHILNNVRWDEMDANQRAAHEGTLLIMSAIHANQASLNRRMSKIEKIIGDPPKD